MIIDLPIVNVINNSQSIFILHSENDQYGHKPRNFGGAHGCPIFRQTHIPKISLRYPVKIDANSL